MYKRNKKYTNIFCCFLSFIFLLLYLSTKNLNLLQFLRHSIHTCFFIFYSLFLNIHPTSLSFIFIPSPLLSLSLSLSLFVCVCVCVYIYIIFFFFFFTFLTFCILSSLILCKSLSNWFYLRRIWDCSGTTLLS